MVVDMLKERGEPPTIDWKDPSPEKIQEKMVESTGAGSPDGWHGQEILLFPFEVAVVFQEVVARWRIGRHLEGLLSGHFADTFPQRFIEADISRFPHKMAIGVSNIR